jgi:hypothetical protein
MWAMGAARRKPVREEQLRGFKYFKKVLPLLDRLHGAGCQRDKAHQRTLHYDQYCALVLLYLLNPIVTSMRGLVQASTLGKVRRKLGVSPTSLGSFSEAVAVFDPPLLKAVVDELAGELKTLPHDARLDDVPGLLTLVDGTVINALGKLVGQMGDGRAIKLHTHFDLLAGVPADIDLTAAHDSEVNNLIGRLLPDRVYVKDRGYACFRLFQEIIDIGSHFVCRIRDNSVYEVVEDRPLTADAKAAGVVSDQVVWLGCADKRDELRQPVRIIRIACAPHRKRAKTGRGGPEQGEFLLIATDLLDTPAEVISLIYRLRWTIEIFFRFFKHVLGCRHLLSHRADGIEIQVLMAILLCLLITLWTGRKPTLRTIEMLQFYFAGWAEEEELEAHIAKLQKCDA